MTWLWDKVRQSLQSGRLRIRIRKLLDVQNSDHLRQASDEVKWPTTRLIKTKKHRLVVTKVLVPHHMHLFFQEEESECEENELNSYFGVCSACKLAINHYRNFNFSALDFLSTRSTTCPFCGLRYRDSTEQQVVDDKENESIDEIRDADRREQRSSSDPTVPRYRLPPIVSNENLFMLIFTAIRVDINFQGINQIGYHYFPKVSIIQLFLRLPKKTKKKKNIYEGYFLKVHLTFGF